MKITKSQLKQIIKEEIGRVIEEISQGYSVKRGTYGVARFLDPQGEPVQFEDPDDGEMEILGSAALMQFTEELPEFKMIVNIDTYNDLKSASRFAYPDLGMLERMGGFKEGKGIKDLFDLYVTMVLKK